MSTHTDNSVTESFRQHLTDKAKELGLIEPKRSHWINYMLSSSEKDEFFTAILPNLSLTKDQRTSALDIGCGYGNLLLGLASHFSHVYGVEILPERVEWVKKRIPAAEVVCASAARLKWGDDWFDLITSTDVFEHIPRDDQATVAAEMFRVTKPGGQGVVKVPNRFQLIDEHNYVLLATWLPAPLRRRYVQLVSRNPYVACWERTGSGWQQLFERAGFNVSLKPSATKFRMFHSGYYLFLEKPINHSRSVKA